MMKCIIIRYEYIIIEGKKCFRNWELKYELVIAARLKRPSEWTISCIYTETVWKKLNHENKVSLLCKSMGFF